MKYIWQREKWPNFVWDGRSVGGMLSEVAYKEGRFLGELSAIGFDGQAKAGLEVMSAEIVSSAAETLKVILDKAHFWRRHAQADFNDHQRQMLNRLLDGFVGNMTSSKWAKICKVSQDTASREISALLAAGILRQEGAGRSTHYVIATNP